LTLRSQTFGESGVAPIERLFNRGPYRVGGGASIVDATSWDAAEGYEVNWVPSMRMVVDLADLDRSRWIDLTGSSGHVFHRHYDDMAPLWRDGETRPWPFSRKAVGASRPVRLLLVPPSRSG
jgi:penicillin amidase